jgi:hypothetical protein
VARPRLFCFVLAKPAERPIRHEYETSTMMVLVSQSLRRPMRSTSVAPAIDTNKFHNAARGNGQSSRDESKQAGRTETTVDRCLLFRVGHANEAKDGRLQEECRLVLSKGGRKRGKAHKIVREDLSTVELSTDRSAEEDDETMTVSGSREERPDAKLDDSLAAESLLDVSQLLQNEWVVTVPVRMLISEDGECFIVMSFCRKPACVRRKTVSTSSMQSAMSDRGRKKITEGIQRTYEEIRGKGRRLRQRFEAGSTRPGQPLDLT